MKPDAPITASEATKEAKMTLEDAWQRFAELDYNADQVRDRFGQQRKWILAGGVLATLLALFYEQVVNITVVAFPGISYGVRLSGGDVDLDGFGEIACTPGPGPDANYPSRYLGFNYDNITVAVLLGFDITPFSTYYGGRVGLADISMDGREDLLCGAGRDPTADATVRAYTYDGSNLTVVSQPFVAFDSSYGVNVEGGALGYY